MDLRKTSRPRLLPPSATPVQPTLKTGDVLQRIGTNVDSIESVVALPSDPPPNNAQTNGGEDIAIILAFTSNILVTENHNSIEPHTLSADHMQATIPIPPIHHGERTALPIPYDIWNACTVGEIALGDLNIVPSGEPHNISPIDIAFGRPPNLALYNPVGRSLEEMVAEIEGWEEAENAKHEGNELELNFISGPDSKGEYLFDFSIPWA